MAIVTIEIPDEQLELFREQTTHLGLTNEELVRFAVNQAFRVAQGIEAGAVFSILDLQGTRWEITRAVPMLSRRMR